MPGVVCCARFPMKPSRQKPLTIAASTASKTAAGKTPAARPAAGKIAPVNPVHARLLALAILLAAAVLLFAQLGHYAVWDDEALVALAAKGVLKTGDTSAMLGNNIVAYRNGLLLRNFHDRSTPPLATYFTAASFAIFGQNSWSARLPFALVGLGCVALVLAWALRERVSLLALGLYGGAILGNVSFFLYSRQCRYYALVMFLSVAVAWLYLRWNKRRGDLALLSVLMGLLFAANYMSYVAILACILVDFAAWRRKEIQFALPDWAALALPQMAIGLGVASVWNPLSTKFGGYVAQNTLSDRFTLFFWQLRDINQCEFLVGALVLAAPAVALIYKDRWLTRALVALALYIAVITAVSPQTVKGASLADVRYLIAIIPLGWFVAVQTIQHLAGRWEFSAPLAAGLAVAAFGCNLLNGGSMLNPLPLTKSGLHSTPSMFLGELMHPPIDPYTEASRWIREHVKAGESVMVQPDYVVAFGPALTPLASRLQEWKPGGYEHVGTVDVFWKDLYRPELFMRAFEPVKGYDPQGGAVYILKRTGLAP